MPFLSSEYGENNETSSAKRLHELSCIKEEDHVELNESFKQNKTIQSNLFKTKSWEILNVFVIMSFVLMKLPSFYMGEKWICQIKKKRK